MITLTLFEKLCAEIDCDYAILSDAARGRLKDMIGQGMRDAFDRGRNSAPNLSNSTLGRQGGIARAKNLTSERRTEIARMAAQARWGVRGI